MAEPLRRTGRQLIARWFVRGVVVLTLLTAVLYVGDLLVLRYRISAKRNPFGVVVVTPYYAIPRKDHKVEFDFDDPQEETCANSLFPHMGDSPCWYLKTHRERRINL